MDVVIADAAEPGGVGGLPEEASLFLKSPKEPSMPEARQAEIMRNVDEP